MPDVPAHAPRSPAEIAAFVTLLREALARLDDPAAEPPPPPPGQFCSSFYREEALLAPAFERAAQLHDAVMGALVRLGLARWYVGRHEHQAGLFEAETGLWVLEVARAADGQPSRDAPDPFDKIYQLGGSAKALALDLYDLDLGAPEALLASPDAHARLWAALLVEAGNAYLRQRQHGPTDGYYARAQELADAVGDPHLRRRVVANRAWLALDQRDLELATERLQQLDMASAEPGFRIEMRRAFLLQGITLCERRRLAEAIPILRRALSSYQQAGDDRDRARAESYLAAALLEQGDVDGAAAGFEQARATGEVTGAPDVRWQAHLGLARVHRRRGDIAAALACYEAYYEAVCELGQSFWTDQGKFSVFDAHAEHLDEMVIVALEVAGSGGDGDPTPVFQAVERARRRSLGDLLTSRAERAPRPPGQLPATRALREESADPFDLLGPRRPDESIAQIYHGAESLLPAWAGRGRRPWAADLGDDDLPAGGAPAATPASGDAPGASPPPPQAFLEHYLLADRVVILLRRPDGARHVTPVAMDRPALDALVAELRRAMDAGTPSGVRFVSSDGSGSGSSSPHRGFGAPAPPAPPWQPAARGLYERLVAPVEALLPADGTPLVIVPHGVLWNVPFAALLGPGDVPLIDRFPLTFAVSHASWWRGAARERARDHRAARCLLVGNPGAGEARMGSHRLRWEALPWAEEEVASIAELVAERGGAADVLVGGQADPLRVAAWHGRYSVVHLATHGVVAAGDPLDSLVAMAHAPQPLWELDLGAGRLERRDDRRLPIELVELDDLARELPARVDDRSVLTARAVLDDFELEADLVVLSACQTGLGQLTGEGVVGLSRAFLAAGARSLVVSLWSVSDQATRVFMRALYAAYLTHGDKARALQAAGRPMRAAGAHPRFWAAFQLVGQAE